MEVSAVTRKPTSADIAYAHTLAEAGCGPAEIVRHLGRQGVKISRFAVSRWINPEQRDKHLIQTRNWNRAKRAENIKPLLQGLSVDARMARMRRWHEAGLSPNAIAKFIGVEHGSILSRGEILNALATGRPPRQWRKETAA